jgi:hypothetical protein
MKRVFPRSLIQVHYHDRSAGVGKVVGLYARAFGRLAAGCVSENLLVCARSRSGGADVSPARVIDVPLCDYRTFSSKGEFERIKASLVESLCRTLADRRVKRPSCLIGHNMSLGKNCALSAAFAEAARRFCRERADFRFYSVIHDFAEEGRLDCLAEIETVRKWTAIDGDLFPPADVVRLITLNAGNAAILEEAGFPALVLNNPVEGPRPVSVVASFPAPVEGAMVANAACLSNSTAVAPFPSTGSGNRGIYGMQSLSKPRPPDVPIPRSLSLSKGPHFRQGLPVILYPSRCISRKNILEAILLCNFVYKSNLMIGAAGTNPKDKTAFEKAVALCKKHRLPVLFDCGKALKDKSEKGVFSNRAFCAADACLTTSVAEGFGYGLYEPWLFGKAVFGRRYLGFSPLAGVSFHGLYDRLPIPVKWISVAAVREKYWTVMNKCFSAVKNNSLLSGRKGFDRTFDEYFVIDNSIDFGCLDIDTQFAVIASLLSRPRRIEAWESPCGRQLSLIRESFDWTLNKSQRAIRENRDRIVNRLSPERFSGAFAKVVSGNRPRESLQGRRDEILRQFCEFDRFRLLLAK